MLHLLDHLRQHRLRRRGAEHDQELVLDIGDEAQDREAGQPRDRAQHDQHEQDAGEIEGPDQRDQVPQRADAVGADRERHGAERADRRDADDDADHAEEHLCRLVDRMRDRLAGLAEIGDGKARQDRDQQHLQQIAARQRPDVAVGNDPHQMRDDALFLGLGDVGRDRFRIDRGRIDVEAGAGFEDFADQQADRERHRRDRLEVDQRLQPDPADALEIAHRGDAVHHRAEDHGRDHHLDQRDEAVAERLERLAEIGIEMSDQDTDEDRDQHLDVEDLVPGLLVTDGARRVSGHGALAAVQVTAIMGWRAATDNSFSKAQGRLGILTPRCTAGRASPRSSQAGTFSSVSNSTISRAP